MQLLEQGATKTWMHPETVSLGRLPMRADADALPGRERQALRRGPSPWTRSLNGDWRFSLAPRRRRYRPTSPSPASTTPTGPSCRSRRTGPCTASTGRSTPTCRCRSTGAPPARAGRQPDRPLPHAPSTLPADWAGRRIVLQVGGAESVLYVWVNGAPVGMGKDSRLPQDFDLTPFLTAGAHNLARAGGGEVVGRLATSRTRTSGGWAASTATCSSTRPASTYIDDVFAERRAGRGPSRTARSPSPPGSASPARRRTAGPSRASSTTAPAADAGRAAIAGRCRPTTSPQPLPRPAGSQVTLQTRGRRAGALVVRGAQPLHRGRQPDLAAAASWSRRPRAGSASGASSSATASS